MKFDVERVKRLYEDYGSLEKAVSAKQEELEKAAEELNVVQGKLQEEARKLESMKREASQLKAELEAARSLREMGYDLATLRLLVERTESCGGIEALLERLTRHVELSKLDERIEQKRKELKSLDSEVGGKRAELNGLDKTLESQKKLRESLEKTISTLRGSLKALNDAEEELKPEVSRLRTEKSELEVQLQALSQQIDQAKEQHANLIRETAKFTESRSRIASEYKNYLEKFGSLKAEAGKLEEELRLAKITQALIKYPSEAKDIPLDYDILMLKAVIEHCAARNVKLKVKAGDIISKKYYSISSRTEVELLDLLKWAYRGLKSALRGRGE